MHVIHIVENKGDSFGICGKLYVRVPEDLPPGTKIYLCEDCRLKALSWKK